MPSSVYSFDSFSFSFLFFFLSFFPLCKMFSCMGCLFLLLIEIKQNFFKKVIKQQQQPPPYCDTMRKCDWMCMLFCCRQLIAPVWNTNCTNILKEKALSMNRYYLYVYCVKPIARPWESVTETACLIRLSLLSSVDSTGFNLLKGKTSSISPFPYSNEHIKRPWKGVTNSNTVFVANHILFSGIYVKIAQELIGMTNHDIEMHGVVLLCFL